jgi:hypothetical protein
LDAADSRLPAATKTALLAEAVRRRWVSAAATWKDVGPGERKAVFFNFRTELVRAGFVRYVEQYQGMYVMCRGLALSLLLTWPMFITWSVLSLNIAQLDLRLRVGTAALLLSTIVALRFSYAQVLEVRGLTPKSAGSKCRRPSVRKMWVGATIGGVAAGVILDAHVPLTPIYAAIMLPMGLVLLRGGLLFRHAHLDFAWTFATTVYREALVVSRAAQPPESAVAPGPTSSSSSGEADD